MFQENIGRAVKEDHKRFDEFSRWYAGLAGTDYTRWRSHIPRPSVLYKAPNPATKRQKAIPEEDASLDRVS